MHTLQLMRDWKRKKFIHSSNNYSIHLYILQHALHCGLITILFQVVDLWAQHSCNNSKYGHGCHPQCRQEGSGSNEDTWGRSNISTSYTCVLWQHVMSHQHKQQSSVTTDPSSRHEHMHREPHAQFGTHCCLLVHDQWLHTTWCVSSAPLTTTTRWGTVVSSLASVELGHVGWGVTCSISRGGKHVRTYMKWTACMSYLHA